MQSGRSWRSWLDQRVDALVGNSTGIAQRLRRAGLEMSVSDFRLEQLLWGGVAFTIVALLGSVGVVRTPRQAVGMLTISAVAFIGGFLVRENWLTSQVKARERQILAEFPIVAELLALSVAAGEGPLAALERVVARTQGALSAELEQVLAQVRTGTPIAHAFDGLASRAGLPVLARFAEGIAIAVERGTPLAQVLHDQAADVAEAGRRSLIESGARREVFMMVPVVFLVMPVVVVFAFWPGLVGLRLVVP